MPGDWICEDNPVRAIDVIVDELDLAELSFGGVEPEATGRPGMSYSAALFPEQQRRCRNV
jgi:hypothetical protein